MASLLGGKRGGVVVAIPLKEANIGRQSEGRDISSSTRCRKILSVLDSFSDGIIKEVWYFISGFYKMPSLSA
jgi:hypothetical protein